MNTKRFVTKGEREQMNGVWFYLLKWHFIYVLILLPFVLLINNWEPLISLLSNYESFSHFFSSLSKNDPIPYIITSSFAAGASFLKWRLMENKYYKLKLKEYKA